MMGLSALAERPRVLIAESEGASQIRTKIRVGGLRSQGKDLSWRSSKVLRIFLRSFLIGFRDFSPSSKLFLSAPRKARRLSTATVFGYPHRFLIKFRRFFH